MRASSEIVLDIDGTASANGPWIAIQNVWQLSLQYASAGDTAGTIKLQFSNDYYGALTEIKPSTATDITGATVSVTAASSGGIPKTDVCYNWVRAVYTKSGGTSGAIRAIMKTNAYS